ncbi:hypothetical protein LXA43DRAFT_888437 [Ganoderma leucocontextum]|nr:hypothetical protein LXA43DRAFT_888437 [Ganoderma leucocontextum]
MSNNVGVDTWNLISGTIGVLTVLPFIWAFVRYQHPETKMAELDSTLKDTEALLRSVSEEGLLDPQRHLPHFTSHLTRYRTKAEAFREDTFIVSVSWRKALRAWSHGLSKRIATLCGQVKEVRAEICETSAERRMQLMKEGADDASPSCCTWYAGLLNIWKCIVSLVSRPSAVETVDPTSTSSTAPVVDAIVASTEDMRSANVVEIPTIACNPCASHPSSRAPPRKAYTHRLKPDHSSFRMSGTATHAHDFRVLASAIRRVDRELTAQGVSNVLLTQLVQATRKRWSPASNKALRPGCSRRQCGSVPCPKNVVAERHPSEPSVNSDMYSSGEGMTCEV